MATKEDFKVKVVIETAVTVPQEVVGRRIMYILATEGEKQWCVQFYADEHDMFDVEHIEAALVQLRGVRERHLAQQTMESWATG